MNNILKSLIKPLKKNLVSLVMMMRSSRECFILQTRIKQLIYERHNTNLKFPLIYLQVVIQNKKNLYRSFQNINMIIKMYYRNQYIHYICSQL
jgi:hypothetical protein